jgi:hypothetical protein
MRPSRTTAFLVIISLAAGIVFMAYRTFGGTDVAPLTETTLSELIRRDGFWEFVLFAVGMIMMIAFEVVDLRNAPPAEIRNGVEADARVIRLWDTGVTVNDDPQVGLLLEIAPPGGGPKFQAESKAFVPRLEATGVHAGTAARVKYDPKKPQRVIVISVEAVNSSPEGTAAHLEEIAALRDRGLIDEAEYDRRRKAILEKL